MEGHGCLSCRNDNLRISQEQFLKKANNTHDSKYSYDLTEYISHKEKIIIICNEHGKFKQTANSHLNGRGCPSCKYSKGESKISNILKIYNIDFTPQKTFDDCRNNKTGRKLYFDFYIQNYNLIIEYDGQHHFRNDSFNNNLEEVLYRDSIKNNYCKIKNINLLRISYKEFKNIENIIKEKIEELSLLYLK